MPQRLTRYSQLSANNRRRKDIYKLPRADQELLTALGYKTKLQLVDEAILANAKFLKQIVADPEIFGHELVPEAEDAAAAHPPHDVGPGNGAAHSHSHGNALLSC